MSKTTLVDILAAAAFLGVRAPKAYRRKSVVTPRDDEAAKAAAQAKRARKGERRAEQAMRAKRRGPKRSRCDTMVYVGPIEKERT